MRLRILVLVLLAVAGFPAASALGRGRIGSDASPQQLAACSPGFVDAMIGGKPSCLRAGVPCTVRYQADYKRYGFYCVNGVLEPYIVVTGTTPVTLTVATTGVIPPLATTTDPSPTGLGRTILLAPRTRTHGCRLGANPDRRCSPGAYYSGLTRRVICAPGFHTSTIRDVPQSEKYQVEEEYGLEPRHYGRTLEIDHIVSLELGGSNDIANLYPEKAKAHPGYHVKDRLENKLHDLVCSGAMRLRAAQRGIARNWQLLYAKVYGRTPGG